MAGLQDDEIRSTFAEGGSTMGDDSDTDDMDTDADTDDTDPS